MLASTKVNNQNPGIREKQQSRPQGTSSAEFGAGSPQATHPAPSVWTAEKPLYEGLTNTTQKDENLGGKLTLLGGSTRGFGSGMGALGSGAGALPLPSSFLIIGTNYVHRDRRVTRRLQGVHVAEEGGREGTNPNLEAT
jgi:hypothetical protein